jgi:hypothetical protein
MSFALDRRAPAPANVGRSQFGTGSRAGLCPGARRACMSGDSAMAVCRIPSGPVTRVRTSASYSMPARRASTWPSSPKPKFEYSTADPTSRASWCRERN